MERNFKKEVSLLQQKLAESEANTIMWQALYDDAIVKLKEYEEHEKVEATQDSE